MADKYTRDFELIAAAEREHILQDNVPTAKSGQELYGLALSGEGVRAAFLCLGLMQALVRGRVLEKMDYMSTVSGGGYIGAALTWFLNRGLPGGKPAGTDPERFPFSRSPGGSWDHKKHSTTILDFLCQQGCYFPSSDRMGFTMFASYVIRTVLGSFVFCFAALLLLVIVSSEMGLFAPVDNVIIPLSGASRAEFGNMFLLAATVMTALFAVVCLSYSMVSLVSVGNSSWGYRFRVYNQVTLSVLIKLAGLALVMSSLPLVSGILGKYGVRHAVILQLLPEGLVVVVWVATSLGVGVLIGGASYFLEKLTTKKGRLFRASKFTSIAALALIAYGLLLEAYGIVDAYFTYALFQNWIWGGALICSVIIVGWRMNINHSGIQRMYRDRLMEAFTPDIGSMRDSGLVFACQADTALIESMCRPPNRRPYHLINATVTLVDSSVAKYRGRGGDSFILSPLYCGSSATGWRKTSAFMKRGGRGMTLPTAMAISGSAVNSDVTGYGPGGARNRWASRLYSLLNLRLGYWASNPRTKDSPFFVPNYFVPLLSQAILGNGVDESKRFVELTDGGCFDSTAIFELVRRKLSVIILCDGTSDPNFTFEHLGNVIERVRMDFGARILFNDPEYDLRWVQPGTAEDAGTADKYGAARRGFAVGRIEYADGSVGRLVYVKSTITEGMSTDVYSYKSSHSKFPHQTAADKFFSEAQIEAYREVGYSLGWQMMEANAGVKPGEAIDPGRSGLWF